MKRRILILSAPATLALILFYACGSSQSASTIDPNAVVTATYSSISSHILQNGCVGCHGGSGGYSFDSYSNTMKAVAAGSPSSSLLYRSISSGSMPQSGTHPSSAQIQVISDWITAGAQNN